MFVMYLVAAVCTLLEKALVEEGDINLALRVVDSREGPLDYFYSYFVKKVFMNKEEEALLEILESPDHRDARSIVLGVLSMESSRSNSQAEYAAEQLRKVASRVSKRYLRNSHDFLATEPFKKLEKDFLSRRRLNNIITMVYSGDTASARLFISLLDTKKIHIGDHVDVLRYLARNNNARALGYLGEVYYHGIGVERSLDRAMYFFSRGKELHDIIGSCGVGKVLMSSEYRDHNNARSALTLANRLGQGGETDYLLYLLFKSQPSYEHHANSYMESSLMNGYLPAICRDGLRYHANKEYLNACIRFYPIVEYSDIVYGFRKQAERYFVEGKYRQSVVVLLMCVELGSVSSMKNAVHVLQKYSVLESQERILFGLYMRLLSKGNYDVINRIGDAYFYGKGVERSYDDAFAFYMSSALLQNAEGYYNVAYMYENGYGVERSLGSAVKYVSKIMPTDDMYLLLLYTYIRLVLRPVSGLLFNRYSVSVAVGALILRKIFCLKAQPDKLT